MASRPATHGHCRARRSGDQPGDRNWGIRDSDDRPFVFPDSSVFHRPAHAHPEANQVRPISILATLLSPFAGMHASTLALRLIERFGSIDRLLAASDKQIMLACDDLQDVGSMIAGARALVLAGLHEAVTRSPVDPTDPSLARYLTVKFKGRPHEELHAIFVAHDHGFLAEELVSKGMMTSVQTRIAPILRRALELGASGLYLIHNHPSQVPEPSVEDIRATRQVVAVAHALDLSVLDHLIVAGNTVTSMRRLNLL